MYHPCVALRDAICGLATVTYVGNKLATMCCPRAGAGLGSKPDRVA